MQHENHPTIVALGLQSDSEASTSAPKVLDAEWLKRLCREEGADDVGLVELSRPALAEERPHAEAALTGASLAIALVGRMNREPIRSPARSVANQEFHHAGDHINEVARRIVARLEKTGVRALNAPMGFPMEQQNFPGRIWVIQHKTVAVEAGLGRMGVHRNVIHPKFGNFILLATVLVAAPASRTDRPIEFNPCLDCQLCVAACPVGAIHSDGAFDFSACYTHNYREFMGGFSDWAENIAASKSAADYRGRVTQAESSSMWQSLSFGANYKAAYCLAVCPAGEEVLAPYLGSKKEFVNRTLRPLQRKVEDLFVIPGTDAESHAKKRFPHKPIRHVGNSLYPTTIPAFFRGLPLVFQRRQAEDLTANYHFTFTGREPFQMTVAIDSGQLRVEEGLQGQADLSVTADSHTWLKFLETKRGLVRALVTRKLKLKGPPKLLVRFGRCFA